MGQLPDNSVDTIITDPPYSLSSIKERFAKTSISDDNQTGKAALNRSNEYARLSRGFMNKEWDNEIAFNPEVWKEALRVAKPGAFLFAMGGSRTYHRLVVAIEDAGWEIRDCITHFYDISFAQQAFLESLNEEQLAAYLEIHYPGYMMHWVYGSGFPKSKDVSKGIDDAAGAERENIGIRHDAAKLNKPGNHQYHEGYQRPWREDPEVWEQKKYITAPATELAQHFAGWGSSIKPAFEPICIAMKPLDGTFAQNAEKWGVSGLWIDGGRIGTDDQSKEQTPYIPNYKNSVFGKGMGGGNWNLSDQGRWPANVTHDSSDEVLGEFAKAGESVSRPSGYNWEKGKHGHVSILQQNIKSGIHYADSGSPARFFYSAKASPSEKGKGNNHPTIKPLALMRYLCRLSKTPYGGVVLDPFAGSGTTLLAARAENREAIGIELEPDYCQIIINRLEGHIDVSPDTNEAQPEENKPKQMKLF